MQKLRGFAQSWASMHADLTPPNVGTFNNNEKKYNYLTLVLDIIAIGWYAVPCTSNGRAE